MRKQFRLFSEEEIAVHKTAHNRRVIPTPEVIHPHLFIVHIRSIPERLQCTQRACHATRLTNRLTPRIVLVFYHLVAVAVNNGNNIALKIMHIRVLSTIVLHDRRLIAGIIEEVQVVAALRHVHDILAMQRVVGRT